MNKLSVLLTAAACSTLPLATLRAQEPSPSPAAAATPAPASSPLPGPAAPGSDADKPGSSEARAKSALRDLSREDRQKLREARRAALADPAVQAAKASGDKRAAVKATREAMVRHNPSVAPILEKARNEMRAEKNQPATPGSEGQKKGGGTVEKQLAVLSEEERAKVIGARRTAQNDPKVAALQKEWRAAATREAKIQAGKAYRQGLRDTMLRNDPSLAPILQKVQDAQKAKVESDSLF